jgi:tRNA modification GTPase
VTGTGLRALLEQISAAAKTLLPGDGAIPLNRRHALLVAEAVRSLEDSANSESVILAENLRLARTAFDRITGRAGVEDVLDALFARFCLGK